MKALWKDTKFEFKSPSVCYYYINSLSKLPGYFVKATNAKLLSFLSKSSRLPAVGVAHTDRAGSSLVFLLEIPLTV